MTYRIARAAARKWADSAAVSGLRHAMLAGRSLGAQHHTLFAAQIAGRSGAGQAASEHYHPFEEVYYFLSGGMLGTLDGDEVDVAAGDMVWTCVDATHGFINRRDEPGHLA